MFVEQSCWGLCKWWAVKCLFAFAYSYKATMNDVEWKGDLFAAYHVVGGLAPVVLYMLLSFP